MSQRYDQAVLRDLAPSAVPLLTTALPAGAAYTRSEGTRVVSALRPSSAPISSLVTDPAASLLALTRAREQQVRLIATPQDAAIDRAATPPWVIRRTLPDLMRGEPSPGRLAQETIGWSGSVDGPLAGRLAGLASSVASYGAVARASGVAGLGDAQASRGASEAWLDDAPGRDAYLDTLDARIGSVPVSRITLTASGTVTMSSDTSQFPATVSNGLDETITVRVVGASDNSARLKVLPSEVVTVRPRDRLTVPIHAEASANGVVGVRLVVATPEGVPLSPEVPVTIEATSLSIVGWIIIAVSGAVLVVTTIARIRQVRARKGSA